jgi:hypothetical protein
MSTNINTGGPAFPNVPTGAGDRWSEWDTGMTLRDWFAGQALAGMVTRPFERANPDYVEESGSVCDAFARQAYEFADAMLAARQP